MAKGTMTTASVPDDSKPKLSYADAEREHARALALLDSEGAAKLSQAEAVVSRLQDSIPREREAFITAHREEQGSRRGELARRWIPRFSALISAWSAAPSREKTTAIMGAVAEHIDDATHSCGSVEPFVFGVASAESVMARHPQSVAIFAQTAAWVEYGGYSGGKSLSSLTNKAFQELQNPPAVVESGRALENLEAQFAALLTASVPRLADIEDAKARWEHFRTGESLIAISERFNAPAYRQLQRAAQAAASENHRRLIVLARGGDAAARYKLGKEEWLAARRLDPETYGPLVE